MLIEKCGDEVYSQYRIPGIVVTNNGTLIAYYECRKSNSDWAKIDIKIIRSTDFGHTWQTITVIKGDGNTLNNPVMIVKDNQIHCLFLKNYLDLYCAVSTDDGKSFGSAKKITLDVPFFYNVIAVGPGHGIVKDGNMLLPVWFAQNKQDKLAHHPSVISTLYSQDGKTWTLGDIIGKDVLQNPSECALAVTPQNEVLISIRNENECKNRAFAVSDNGFSGWRGLHFNPQMIDPICMGSMCYDNKTVYHINCEHTLLRENLTIKYSRDNFNTFERIPVDNIAGYADIAVLDNTLYVLYERDCNKGGLYFKRIKL